MAAFRFLTSTCYEAKAVIKMDPDVGWNIEKTTKFVEESLRGDSLYCGAYVFALQGKAERISINSDQFQRHQEYTE